MIFISLLIAPILMAVATLAERRLGPSAAGWLAALPVSFAVVAAAVAIAAGDSTARTMALSAATHVPAQIVFAVVFAAVLTRRGVLLGAAAGALAYVACSLIVTDIPSMLAVALAVPALALAPGLMAVGRPRVSSPGHWTTTLTTCVASAIVVGSALLTISCVGPVAAGAVAAFPTLSATLAVVIVHRDGPSAGAHALGGLVRSLPCYLTFCLVVVLAAPSVGLPAIALALLACLATGHLTWRTVPLAPHAAAAH